ncbi:MAG TPA: hypothetical protein VGO64_10385, partial [Candidatus Limnocylindrales bacterium]|nr:hypothetical protein [Candidatus Limnocylindrales bacterium]
MIHGFQAEARAEDGGMGPPEARRAQVANPPGGDVADATQPGELTEVQLEALLFVAERPLTRREIATVAGVDRATVDARL